MKVFISWSGALSQNVAGILREWLPLVVPFAKPYVSAEDIDKGARWSTDIAGELQASGFGIICVTQENTGEPWINFEAGALSRAIDTSRVCPLLLDLRPAHLEARSPLLQFQTTAFDKPDMWRLIQSVARAGAPHEAPYLEKQFEAWWPQLEARVQAAVAEVAPSPTSTPKKSRIESMLEELLELAREHQRLIASPAEPHRVAWRRPPVAIHADFDNLADALRILRSPSPGEERLGAVKTLLECTGRLSREFPRRPGRPRKLTPLLADLLKEGEAKLADLMDVEFANSPPPKLAESDS